MEYIRILCWFITAAFFWGAFKFYELSKLPYASSGTGMIIFSLLCAAVALYFSVKFELQAWKARKEAEEQETARQMRDAQAMQRYQNGTWAFPAKEFYRKCTENGITKLDHAFSLEKAKLLVVKIMQKQEYPVPAEYQHWYVSEQKLREYFQTGQLEIKQLAEAEKQKRDEWNRTPHKASPNEEQCALFALACGTKDLYGIQKRKYLLENSVRSIEEQIRRQKEAKEAMRQVGVLLSSSAAQKPKSDWAMLGGIAEGIAGPAAGIAAAADAMRKNAETEEWNRQNRQAVDRITMDIYSRANEVNATITEMETAKRLLSKELAALSEKVVLSGIDTGTLWNHLEIRTDRVVKSETNVLVLTTTLKNNYIPDVPEEVQMTVDGVLKATVYRKDTVVGTAIVPLPLYGAECQSAVSFDSLCEDYMEGNKSYHVCYEPIALWLMEL